MQWIDPTRGYPDDTLVNGVTKKNGYAAVTGQCYHKSFHPKAIHSTDLEHVDDKDWELFHQSLTGVIEDKNYIWGMFVEGIGAVNVMVPSDQVRDLTSKEKRAWSGKNMSMVGSHTGKLSYDFNMPELE